MGGDGVRIRVRWRPRFLFSSSRRRPGSSSFSCHSDESLPISVIPAEAGIHLLSSFDFFGASRNPTHVPVSIPRIPARESLSLACPRESNQREGHPRGRGRRASCPATSRGRSGGSLTARPCADSERARIVRAPLAGFVLRALAATEREPGRSRARPSWPQKQRSMKR